MYLVDIGHPQYQQQGCCYWSEEYNVVRPSNCLFHFLRTVDSRYLKEWYYQTPNLRRCCVPAAQVHQPRKFRRGLFRAVPKQSGESVVECSVQMSSVYVPGDHDLYRAAAADGVVWRDHAILHHLPHLRTRKHGGSGGWVDLFITSLATKLT